MRKFQNAIGLDSIERGAIKLENYSAQFDDEEINLLFKTLDPKINTIPTLALKSITLSINPNEFVGIYGTVGAGKTSLLRAMIGQLHQIDGVKLINGRVVYVPQIPLIINDSLKNNILFGLPYDPKKYRAAIEQCQLIDDISKLQKGDDTLLGQRGINLSGG